MLIYANLYPLSFIYLCNQLFVHYLKISEMFPVDPKLADLPFNHALPLQCIKPHKWLPIELKMKFVLLIVVSKVLDDQTPVCLSGLF